MKDIPIIVFEENQRLADEKELEKVKGLKDELNLTEKIFALKTSDFNRRGKATIYHIYIKTMKDQNPEMMTSDEYENKRKINIETNKIYEKLRIVLRKNLSLDLLVDVLEPEANLSISSWGGSISISYYHPEMDQIKKEQEKLKENSIKLKTFLDSWKELWRK
jgi:hypothetical protein